MKIEVLEVIELWRCLSPVLVLTKYGSDVHVIFQYWCRSCSILLLSGDNPSPLAILTGHEQPVVCVDVSASMGLVVSGSQGMYLSEKIIEKNTIKVRWWMYCFVLFAEGPCLLHTTTGNLLRTLRGPGECVRPRLLKLSRDGLVLVNYTDGTGHLAVFTINGRLLSDKRLDDQMLVCIVNHEEFLRQSKAEQSQFFASYATMWSKT